MRFTIATAVAFFGATAFAVSEDVKITEFNAEKSVEGAIKSISFQLAGNEGAGVKCGSDLDTTSLPTADLICDLPNYHYTVDKGETSEFALIINHQSAEGRLQGRRDVPAYCTAAGGDRVICTQTGDVTIPVADTAVGK